MREKELAKWLLGVHQEKQEYSSQVKGQGIPLSFGITYTDARTNRQWSRERGSEGTVVFFPRRGAHTLKLEKKCSWLFDGSDAAREQSSAQCVQNK